MNLDVLLLGVNSGIWDMREDGMFLDRDKGHTPRLKKLKIACDEYRKVMLKNNNFYGITSFIIYIF